MEPLKRLSDLRLRSLINQARHKEEVVPDGSVPGLSVRLFPGGAANWALSYRVAGEGGVNSHGRALVGKKHRVSLGGYPTVSLEEARSKANHFLAQAKQGINPKDLLKAGATASGLTVGDLADQFMKEHIYSRELDSAKNYRNAFEVHILPRVGGVLADVLTREDARSVMNEARKKRKRLTGDRGGQIGGIEAARTTMSVLRHMYSWAIDERKVRRMDNPCTKITKNLPKRRQGDVVLSLRAARIVWQAAADVGYPFGTHAQLMMLTGCRTSEWALAEDRWIDLEEKLMVIPTDKYKTDHVHIVPLVPQAVTIVAAIPERASGRFILSSTNGSCPIQGISKFFRTRLEAQIIANTGAPIPKRITSHALRRTVATRLAESLGDEGDKLIKRVLGHSDGSVTAIYNRYGYVREMRRALEKWASALTAEEGQLQDSAPDLGARAA